MNAQDKDLVLEELKQDILWFSSSITPLMRSTHLAKSEAEVAIMLMDLLVKLGKDCTSRKAEIGALRVELS